MFFVRRNVILLFFICCVHNLQIIGIIITFKHFFRRKIKNCLVNNSTYFRNHQTYSRFRYCYSMKTICQQLLTFAKYLIEIDSLSWTVIDFLIHVYCLFINGTNNVCVCVFFIHLQIGSKFIGFTRQIYMKILLCFQLPLSQPFSLLFFIISCKNEIYH